jgi:AcrR family transcriptional regulator
VSTAAAPENTTDVGPRLAPDERRRHLLDVAASIVETDGMAELTMEHVADRAGVSRALVYAYFRNRPGLVRSLWADVADRWGGDPMPDIPVDASAAELRALFEERLVGTTRWYFDMIERGGLLYHRLLAEPDLDDATRPFRRRILDGNVEWWAHLGWRLGLASDQSLVFATMFNGASERLWDLVAERVVDRDVIESVFVDTARSSFELLLATAGKGSA